MQFSTRILALLHLAGAGLHVASAAMLPRQTPSISPSCESSLKGLLTSPDAECLNFSALASFAINAQSVPKTVDNWLSGMCTIGTCTDAALNSVIGNLTTGCSEELSGFGISSSTVSQVTDIVKKAYPTVRQMLCLRDDTTDSLCAVQEIQAVENIVGSVDASDIGLSAILGDISKVFSSGVSNITCTSCVKQMYNVAMQGFPDIVSESTSTLQNLCGASFIDGSQATGVSQSAVNAVFAPKQNNGAVGFSSVWWRNAALLASVLLVLL